MNTLWFWFPFRKGFFTCINISFSLMQECSCTTCAIREKTVKKIRKRNKMTQNWTPKERERRNLLDAKKGARQLERFSTCDLYGLHSSCLASLPLLFCSSLSMSCSSFCLGDRVGLRYRGSQNGPGSRQGEWAPWNYRSALLQLLSSAVPDLSICLLLPTSGSLIRSLLEHFPLYVIDPSAPTKERAELCGYCLNGLVKTI